jgi:FKBP-type peptidyl-prolyl cis-trans isomerase SlyD
LQDRNVHPGLTVELDGRKGVVSRVIGRRVTVDFNSPLAGKNVVYEYEIEKIFESGTEKIQGLLALYTGLRDLEVEIEDQVAKIYVPTGLTFIQRWLMSKNRIATELFTYADFKEIQLIEKLTPESQAKVMDEIEQEIKEESEDKTESQSEDPSEAEN